MTIRFIVNADDYGHAPGVSAGIRKAHLDGIVSTTTTMMTQPDALPALALAHEECPRLGVGVHLVLTHGAPMLPAERVPSLITADGQFPHLADLDAAMARMDASELRDEWQAQIETFLATGVTLDHLDCHHHAAYRYEKSLAVLFDLAKAYDAPIRHPFAPISDNGAASAEIERIRAFALPLMRQHPGVRAPSRMIGSFYDTGTTVDNLLGILDSLTDAETAELMVHPGYADDDLMTTSSYNTHRQTELDILTSDAVKAKVRERGIELVTFRGL